MIGAYSSISYDQEQLALNRKVTNNFGFHDENLSLDEMVGDYFISQDYLYAELIELIGIELDYRSIEIEGIEPFHILRHRGWPMPRPMKLSRRAILMAALMCILV